MYENFKIELKKRKEFLIKGRIQRSSKTWKLILKIYYLDYQNPTLFSPTF
jgi:hypothetical protein